MSSLDLPPHVPDYSHATGQCLVHLKLCLLAFIGLEPPPAFLLNLPKSLHDR